MVTRSEQLATIGLSLADLVLEVFCFAATPSFKAVATLVATARQAVNDVGTSSPEFVKDRSMLSKRVIEVLTKKVKAAREQCLDRGIDASLLAQAESAVAALISTDAEEDLVVLSAVRDPEGFEKFFTTRAAKHRQQIEEQSEPYFDALVRAVAATYVEIAPWSDSFVVSALKSMLDEFTGMKEQMTIHHMEDRQLFDQILQLLQSLAEAIEELRKPSHTKRVNFGSRPDVVVGGRFVERDEHKQLKAVITDTTRHQTVLLGMRGCGKTQLAASLARQCENANWNLVAWINAVSRESIQSDLVELAKRLKIDTSDLPTQDEVIRRCLNHLQSVGPTDRLIVFDNVEDINHLTGLIPSGDGVRVVATTTNKVGWEDQGWNSIRVGVFDRSTSIEYLLTVTNSDDREAADTLAERLGDLPVAVAQAAATARNKDLSLARYLERLESHGEELVIRPIPGDEYTDDVATVLWMAAEDAVDSMKNDTKEMARRQLGALALLAESGVPTRWLDPTIEQQDDWELEGTNPAEDEDAHDALTELIHRSIVQQSTDRSTTMLHRLQAQVLRESWDETESVQATQAAAALLGRVSINAIPRNDTRSRRRETRDLIEQLQAISTQDYSGSLFGFSQVRYRLNEAFRHAYDLGLPFEALTLNKAVDIIGALLGPDHHDTLTSRNNLAYTFLTVGRTEEAITLYEQTLKDTIGLGEDHPRTFIARSDLAHAYQTASRLDEAIELRKQSVKGRSRILGEDHPRTFIARSDLAHTYQWAGRLNEATTLFTQNLQDSIRVLGEKHPYTLASRNNLAREYQWLERTNESIDLLEQSLQDSTRILGENHPQTLGARIDLAHVYQADGRLNEAITLLEQSLQDSTRILGEDDPQTLSVRNDLADAYRWANRTNDAITLFKQAVDDRLHALGEDHPRTLSALNDLARAYRWAGRLNEAITLYKKTLQDSIRVLGEDHPDTLGTRDNLAGAYRRAGRLDKAIQLFEQTLNDCIRVLGEAHPFTATVRENLEAARRELKQQAEDSANEEREQED